MHTSVCSLVPPVATWQIPVSLVRPWRTAPSGRRRRRFEGIVPVRECRRWGGGVALRWGAGCCRGPPCGARSGSEPVASCTKSLAGERRLPLPDLIGAALADFKATQVIEKLAAGERYEDNEYVLVDRLGRALKGGSCVSAPTGSWPRIRCAGSVCTTPVRSVSRTWRTTGCRTICLPAGQGTPTSARRSGVR